MAFDLKRVGSADFRRNVMMAMLVYLIFISFGLFSTSFLFNLQTGMVWIIPTKYLVSLLAGVSVYWVWTKS